MDFSEGGKKHPKLAQKAPPALNKTQGYFIAHARWCQNIQSISTTVGI